MPKTELTEKSSMFKRELLDIQFATYRRIVEKKHGITVPMTLEASRDLSDEDLQAYVDSLKDMAHLPPA